MARLDLFLAALVWSVLSSTVAAAEKPLNFVFFLVDDLGYMDVSCNNPDTFYETAEHSAFGRKRAAIYRWICGQSRL